MDIPIYQVDAFTRQAFRGNPAAVMPLDDWLEDALLQAIALENNLSETAFMVPRGGVYQLRWFTPAVEADLCGHATLAAAHVLFAHRDQPGDEVVFHSRSGELRVSRSGGVYTLDFPAYELAPATPDPAVCAALGAPAAEALAVVGAGNMLYVYGSEREVAALAPDFGALRANSECCVIATAPGDSCDFVSRYFAPQVGIDEDPVTGSAHCALVPYWSRRLGRNALAARQISARGGELDCRYRDPRVDISGRAVSYMQGVVTLR